MEAKIETGFHYDGKAYANVSFDAPLTRCQIEYANECAREVGRSFAKMLDNLAVNGKQWTDYADEVKWYAEDGWEVADEDYFEDVRTVQCMVCAVD